MKDLKSNKDQCITVLYDGACPLCQREIAMYKNLTPIDDRLQVTFEDVNDPTTVISAGMTRAQLLQRFHVRNMDQELVSGAKAFIALWAVLPGWRWLAKIGSLPGATWCMEILYVVFLFVRPLLQRLASIGRENGYVSDTTKFINQLKRQDPKLEEKQLHGRNLLWNRVQDLDINKELAKGRVPQKSYVYYDNIRYRLDKDQK